MVYLLKIVVFHSYVSLPEGISFFVNSQCFDSSLTKRKLHPSSPRKTVAPRYQQLSVFLHEMPDGLKIRSGSIYRVFQILMSCLINIINFLSDFQGTLPFVLGLNCRIFWDLLKMSREPGIWQQWTCCPYRFPISCMALEPGQNEPMQISTTLRIIRKTYLFIYGSLNWPDVSLCFIICHYCSLFLCPIILYVH